jgi:glucosylceramidase
MKKQQKYSFTKSDLQSVCSVLLFILLMGCSPATQQVTWVSTTDEARWVQQPEVKTTQSTDKPYIEILTDEPKQTIDGFGGCFNELSWDAIRLLDEPGRQELLKNLFDPNDGLNFTFCRTPMGANDYAREWYSYNETDGDFEMKHFSIERDKEAVIPFIKAALALNPNIKLWASPWSVPTWMKTNKHYANRSMECNDLPKEREVPIYTDQIIQETEYLQALALYFSKYLDAYQKEGIDVSMVMYQNEAFTFNQWPTGSWTPQSIARFNMEYLGPQLAKTHPHVEIYAGTFNTADSLVYATILNHPDAKKYIKGIGVQWEAREIFPTLKELYPGFKWMQSESECGNGRFGWKDAQHTFDLMKRYINHGAHSYIEWNMVLKDDGRSSWCWTQNALIRILSDTKEVIYTPEYYVYKHVCSFVPVGSVVLPFKSANTGDNNLLAFKTPSGEIIIVTGNYNDTPNETTFKLGEKYFTVVLPAHSFNTFKLGAKS